MPLDVDAVLFDLDDTLCVYERSVEDMLALAFDRAGVEPFFDGATYRAAFDRHLEAFDDVDELRAHCFAEIAGNCGREPDLGREIAAEYAAARDPARVAARDGAREAIREIADRYPVGLITNGGRELQRRKLERIGLADAFETVVYAGEETAPKPEPEPFERALAELSVEPARAAFVGNSLRSDVAGAAAVGLRTVWAPAEPERHDAADHPEPAVRVDDLRALPERLGDARARSD